MGLFKRRKKEESGDKDNSIKVFLDRENVESQKNGYNTESLLKSIEDEEKEERRKKQLLQSYINSSSNPINQEPKSIKTNNLDNPAILNTPSGINFNEISESENEVDLEEYGRSLQVAHSITKKRGSKGVSSSGNISKETHLKPRTGMSSKRTKLVSELKPHIHKNNIIKTQLLNDIRMDKMNEAKRRDFIDRFKSIKGYSDKENSSQKQTSNLKVPELKPQQKEAPVKLTEKRKVDPTASLIYDTIIFDPRKISREFNKIRYNDELINKVISTRIDRTLSKLRKNKYRVTKNVRLMLFTDLCIIEQAIQRGFRPKYMKIDRQLFEASHYDNSITLTECLHEIALCFGRQGSLKMIKKIDEVDKEKDITNYVLYNLNNPMEHLNAVRNKLEHTRDIGIEMEKERWKWQHF